METKRVLLKKVQDKLLEINNIENKSKKLKDSLIELISEIARECNRNGLRKQVIRDLYWDFEEVKTDIIADAFGFKNKYQLVKEVGEKVSELRCDRCGKFLSFKSRSSLKDAMVMVKKGGDSFTEGYTIVCDTCKKEIYKERNKKSKRDIQDRENRFYQLKSMAYKEYLETPEWQKIRKRKLRRAKYKCQICNASNKELNVHHRTYKRRGEERDNDLIVLCKDCHVLYHRSDLLKREA